jgi:hypothetical protein
VALAAQVIFTAAVEGLTDEAVLRRLIEVSGATLGPVYGKHGKGFRTATL